MMTPLSFIQDKVLVPLYLFRQKYISKNMMRELCQKSANYIAEQSRETAVILLSLNAISTISSHISQIRGLKKNKRDNAQYLIHQEWQELGLDLLLTIIPPFILNKFLMQKLDSGEWTTKSARDILLNKISLEAGVSPDDLYNTQHIVSLRETVGGMIAKQIDRIRKTKHVHPKVEKFFKYLTRKYPDIRIPDPNKIFPLASMDDITTSLDSMMAKKNKVFENFYHGSAYDEISGQRNGILILAAIAYTVVASCIVAPIIKNKLANKSYKKYIDRQRQKVMKHPKDVIYKSVDFYNNNQQEGIFDTFCFDKNTKFNVSETRNTKDNVFLSFNNFSSHSSGLRI